MEKSKPLPHVSNDMLVKILSLPVLVTAFGQMVDIFDVVSFSIVRTHSLIDLGVAPDQTAHVGIFILNVQMGGMLIGSLFWGICGDKAGRVRMMFATIFCYSLGSFASAFVHDVSVYALARFVTGFGLAGELGLAFTVVLELLSKEKRGYGTALVAMFGSFGSVLAGLTSQFLDWRELYMLGGVLGFLIMYFRYRISESLVFQNQEQANKGRVSLFVSNRRRLMRLLVLTAAGMPLQFTVIMAVFLSPELVKISGLSTAINVGIVVMCFDIAMSCGDVASAWVSQILKSRRIPVILFHSLGFGLHTLFLLVAWHASSTVYYVFFAMLGFSTGYWSAWTSLVTESFGTNLRATASTFAPAMVRASAIPVGIVLQQISSAFALNMSVFYMACVVYGISVLAVFFSKETFGISLGYQEKKI